MFSLNFRELGDRSAEIAQVLMARGSVFVEFETSGDLYDVLLALGPRPRELAFAVFDRNVALVVSIGANELSARYLGQKCPHAARGDLEPLAMFVNLVMIELRESSFDA